MISTIFALLLIGFGLYLFAKMMPLLLKVVVFFLRFLLHAVIAIPIWILLLIFVPGFLDEGAFLLFLFIFTIIRLAASDSSGWDSSSSSSTYSSGGYVLNRKSGVIHDRWSTSADTISDKHKKVISFSEAMDLIGRGTKYRFKDN